MTSVSKSNWICVQKISQSFRSTVASLARIFRQTDRSYTPSEWCVYTCTVVEMWFDKVSMAHCWRTQWLTPTGGRANIYKNILMSQQQDSVEMVTANNSIRSREIHDTIIADNIFSNIENVSTITITQVLQEHQIRMKQLHTVPFERKSSMLMNSGTNTSR